MSRKPICNESSNDSIVSKDIFVMMGGVIEDSESVVDEGAFGVHVDEAGDSEWGCKETIFEQMGVDLFAFGEVYVMSTLLKGGNACSYVV
jgi:hypothetical protein